jgi:hypothetical protein
MYPAGTTHISLLFRVTKAVRKRCMGNYDCDCYYTVPLTRVLAVFIHKVVDGPISLVSDTAYLPVSRSTPSVLETSLFLKSKT